MYLFVVNLFIQVVLDLYNGRTGQYVHDVIHTDHQGHTTAVSASVASVEWTIIVLGELHVLEKK
jgi:hypothetical protein